ncbi:hypothetical protein BTIS_0811 [Bifidobacterium tissieri]|uniref:Uncharacterized protein n=1 Tax=Bifidobacterium tissieri TaxID=1630162 RepID=A0A261FH16_9BIFI|nr:hypothetical protein [Bifidobacterium tissieri]OZG58442.1 hypothetical protein BTIS_0811 [Bifidobacterium tissieri]
MSNHNGNRISKHIDKSTILTIVMIVVILGAFGVMLAASSHVGPFAGWDTVQASTARTTTNADSTDKWNDNTKSDNDASKTAAADKTTDTTTDTATKRHPRSPLRP